MAGTVHEAGTVVALPSTAKDNRPALDGHRAQAQEFVSRVSATEGSYPELQALLAESDVLLGRARRLVASGVRDREQRYIVNIIAMARVVIAQELLRTDALAGLEVALDAVDVLTFEQGEDSLLVLEARRTAIRAAAAAEQRDVARVQAIAACIAAARVLHPADFPRALAETVAALRLGNFRAATPGPTYRAPDVLNTFSQLQDSAHYLHSLDRCLVDYVQLVLHLATPQQLRLAKVRRLTRLALSSAKLPLAAHLVWWLHWGAHEQSPTSHERIRLHHSSLAVARWAGQSQPVDYMCLGHALLAHGQIVAARLRFRIAKELMSPAPGQYQEELKHLEEHLRRPLLAVADEDEDEDEDEDAR